MILRNALCKPLLTALVLAAAAGAAVAGGPQGSAQLSNASILVADGSAVVVGGSLATLAAAGSVVLASVEVAGDASVLVLKGAADGVGASVRLSRQAARGASGVVGAAVEVVALSTGYLLVTAGRVIAFVPNQAGRALLLHHARVAERD